VNKKFTSNPTTGRSQNQINAGWPAKRANARGHRCSSGNQQVHVTEFSPVPKLTTLPSIFLAFNDVLMKGNELIRR